MMQRDNVYQVWWFTPGEIEQQESWLSDMAAQGLHLERVVLSNLAVFKRGESTQTRYRCEATTHLSEEQRELYELAGWDYVASRRNIHVFRAPVNQTIPEIHTDSREQAKLFRGFARSLCLGVLWLLFAIISLVRVNIRNQTLLLRAIIDLQWWSVALAALVTLALYFATAEAIHVLRLVRALDRGRTLNHSVNYEKVMAKRRLSAGVLVLLSVLGCSGWILAQAAMLQAEKFPAVPEEPLPIVTLYEVLDDAGLKGSPPPTGFGPEKGSLFNYYRVSSSLFLPRRHELHQYFMVYGAEAHEGRRVTLRTLLYEARSPEVAGVLARELASSGVFWSDKITPPSAYTQVSAPPGVDALWLGEARFIMLRGNTVQHVLYSGLGSLERVIELTLTR